MKILSSIVAVTALSLGTAGAAIAYTSNSDSPTSSTRITPRTPTVAKEPAAGVRTRFRPCKPGARLEGGKCVRHVVRTVVVPAPPAPVAANTPTTRSRPEDHRGSGLRDSTENRDDRAHEQEAEDEEHGEGHDEHEDDEQGGEQGDDD